MSFRTFSFLILTLMIIFLKTNLTFKLQKNSKIFKINKFNDNFETNDKPIIGIVSVEIDNDNDVYPDENYNYYIAASYVKFIEMSGARVVPIIVGKNESYYIEILNYINGIVFTGGNGPFDIENNQFTKTSNLIYTEAKKKKLPILAICLGFELLVYLENKGQNAKVLCLAQNVAKPLDFRQDFRQSKTFRNAPDDLIQILANEDVTANFHHYCVTEKILKNIGLLKEFKILSTNKDLFGLEFVSSYESRNYPIFAFQFHPEKNPFEWKSSLNIPHSYNAIRVTHYFSELFVNETRKNLNKFPNEEMEREALIYNYQKVYTGFFATADFQEVYYFK